MNGIAKISNGKKAYEAGFLLIEALIAVVILAVGLLVLAQFHNRLIQTSTESRAASEATHIAQQQVDALRALPLEDADVQPGSHSGDLAEGVGGRLYEIDWVVAAVADNDTVRSVSVTVQSLDNPDVPAILHSYLADASFDALPGTDDQENPGDWDFLEWTETKYADENGEVELPVDFETGGEGVGVRIDEDGAVVEIASLSTGDALRSPVDGTNTGYAKISGNLIFRLEGGGGLTDLSDPLSIFKAAHDALPSESSFDVFDDLIYATPNSICGVFPTYRALENDAELNQATLVEVNGEPRYRVLGYACFVSNNWFGSVEMRAPVTRDICTGNPSVQAWCDPDAVLGEEGYDPECALDERVSEPDTGTLRRTYIGFDSDPDGSIETELGRFTYSGIRGSTRYGGAEHGSVCGSETPSGGPETCLVENDLSGVALLIPGGHHFLITQLQADGQPVTGQLSRWNACREEVGKFSEPAAGTSGLLSDFQGRFFVHNPSRFVCLTPDTCNYYTRFGGVIKNEASALSERVRVRWNDFVSESTLGSGCEVFGAFGAQAGVFWCMLDNADLGTVRPLNLFTDGTLFEPDIFYYFSKTTDPVYRGGYQEAGVAEDEIDGAADPTNILKRIDFTHFNFAMKPGDTLPPDEDGPSTGLQAPDVGWGGEGTERQLVWAPQDGVTHEVCTCSRSSGNSLATCEPLVGHADACKPALSPWDVPKPPSQVTECHSVVAMDGTERAQASTVFCHHWRSNGDKYTFSSYGVEL